MIPHLWELRADVAPLEQGAVQWDRLAADLAATADGIVDAARHALDQGWESEAAESYEAQRRQIVRQIDTFTTVAAHIGTSLKALAGMLTTAQEELDRVWLTVASVPHDVVGAERVLVLHPTSPAEEELVRSATEAAKAVRSRLQDQLYAESARLRDSRMELGTVRSDLLQATRSAWPVGTVGGIDGLGDASGVVASGSVVHIGVDEPGALGAVGVDGTATTSVAGAPAGGGGGLAAAGAPVLPGIAPFSLSTPDLTGLSASALAAGAGAGLLGAAAARRGRNQETAPVEGTGMAPVGGMAAGAAMRGGALGRPGSGGASGGRSGAVRPVPPERKAAEDRAARVAREKEEAREAKRRLIAQRQAERAARRAQRTGPGSDEHQHEPPSGIEVSEVAPGEGPPSRRG